MVGRTTIPIVLLLVITALAGCLSMPDDPDSDSGQNGRDSPNRPSSSQQQTSQPRPPPETDPEAEHGALAGRVVTQDFDYIKGARIVLATMNDTEIGEDWTDDEGRYAFEDLEPGEYRISASAVCCREHLVRVQVQAGELTEEQVVLERLTGTDLKVPYTVVNEWNGYIGCSIILVFANMNSNCQDPNHDTLYEFEVSEGLKTVLVTVEWDNTVNLKETIIFNVYRHPSPTYASIEAASPIEIRLDAGEIGGDDDFENIKGEWDFRFRAQGGYGSLMEPDVQLVYQQPFTVYYELHYWEHAEDDARAGPE